MSDVKVTDRDNGAAALLREMLVKGKLKIGILADAPKEGSEDGATLLEVAAAHELGLGVPRRSFLADWETAKREDWRRVLRKLEESVIKGRRTQLEALNLFGLWCKGSIQLRISNGEIEPELAPETIARKGSSVPLIDKGQLRASIDYAVEGASAL